MEPTITLNDQILKATNKFTYLGSTLSRVIYIDDEISARIPKTNIAFGRINLHVSAKLKVYRAIVLSILLYACETWTV